MASKKMMLTVWVGICLCVFTGTQCDSSQRKAGVKVSTHVVADKHIGPKVTKGAMKIVESAECKADAQKLCVKKPKARNFFYLTCLQDSITDKESLSTDCNHFLWRYKKKFSDSAFFDRAVYEICSIDLKEISVCQKYPFGKGQVIPCLMDHYEAVKSMACRNFINKMAYVVFSDYNFMEPLMTNCSNDIETLKCGRLENPDYRSTSSHLQGKTISCLNEPRRNVSKPCQKVLMKLAELQSDDYHLDRPLYYACKGDRESLCPNINSGDRAVFKCLYKHLGDPHLTPGCKEKLEARQDVITEDVKAEKSFYRACSRDIKHNDMQAERAAGRQHRRQFESINNLALFGESKKKVSSSCVQAMFKLRSEQMQDYQDVYKQCLRDALHFAKSKGNTLEPKHGPLIYLHRMMHSEADHDPKLHKTRNTDRLRWEMVLLDLLFPSFDFINGVLYMDLKLKLTPGELAICVAFITHFTANIIGPLLVRSLGFRQGGITHLSFAVRIQVFVNKHGVGHKILSALQSTGSTGRLTNRTLRHLRTIGWLLGAFFGLVINSYF